MIYVLEDEESIRNLILYTLEQSGLEAKGFGTAAAFLKECRAAPPSLALLDIMLPDMDGLTVLKRLRDSRETARLPVIMATAKGTEYDRVLGLNTGADDYLPKPFSMMELIARIRRLLWRSGGNASDSDAPVLYRFATAIVNAAERTVKVDGQYVQLTLKEFDTLLLLLKSGGAVLSRDKIMNEVWGYYYDGESRTVDVHIRSLRVKLGSAGDAIETVRGIGYRIVLFSEEKN